MPTTLTRVGHAASLAACDRLKALQPPAKQGGLAKRHCCDAVAASVRLGTHLEALEMGKMNNSTNAMANSISEKKRLELEALSFELGLAEEARLFDQLVASQQSAAKRHLFFAERAAGRLPRTSTRTAPAVEERRKKKQEEEEEEETAESHRAWSWASSGREPWGAASPSRRWRRKRASWAALWSWTARPKASARSLHRPGVGSLQRRGRLSKVAARRPSHSGCP